MKRIKDSKCFLGTIILSILVMLGFWNYDSVARLVSGTASHNHSSSSAGGSSLNVTSLQVGDSNFSITPDSFTVTRKNDALFPLRLRGESDIGGGTIISSAHYSNTANTSPEFTGYRYRGTITAELPAQAGDELVKYAAVGLGASNTLQQGGYLQFEAATGWGTTNPDGPTQFRIAVSPDNSDTPVTGFLMESDLVITLANTLKSTKTCAAGYTRQTPNLCTRNAGTIAYTGLVRDACTTVAAPTGAKVVKLTVVLNSTDTLNVASFSNNLCGATDQFNEIELNIVGTTRQHMEVVVPGVNFFLKMLDGALNTSSATYRIISYID